MQIIDLPRNDSAITLNRAKLTLELDAAGIQTKLQKSHEH